MTDKTKLRKQCDAAWFKRVILDNPRCEVCGKIARQVHHFFPRSQFAHLRYNLDNGISLCFKCHFAHHHKGDPRIHQAIIEKRGIKWYKNLRDISRKSPNSYQTLTYYRRVLKDLTNYD